MELLIEVDKCKWPELRDLYENDWPKNAVAYCVLDANISYTDLCETFNFKVYCPEGDINNGMVATSDGGDYIRVHPLNDIHIIEKSLATTKVIDWNKPVTVASATPEVDECFERLSVHLDVEIVGEKAFKHLLNKDSTVIENIYLPPNTYIAEAKSEHLDIIDKTWTYHGENTIKYFEALKNNHLLFVLYTNEGSPLAWVGTDNDGHLSHLYCSEEHRRKGYAECILRYVTNKELKKRKNILAYTLENNTKPKNLFDKLNFDRIGRDRWLSVEKIKK